MNPPGAATEAFPAASHVSLRKSLCNTNVRIPKFFLAVALADPPATLPTPWNAGFVDMAWITEDFTKSEVPQRQDTFVPDIEKVPLQGFFSVPAESVWGTVCNVKVFLRF